MKTTHQPLHSQKKNQPLPVSRIVPTCSLPCVLLMVTKIELTSQILGSVPQQHSHPSHPLRPQKRHTRPFTYFRLRNGRVKSHTAETNTHSVSRVLASPAPLCSKSSRRRGNTRMLGKATSPKMPARVKREGRRVLDPAPR